MKGKEKYHMHMKLYLLHYMNNWECLLIRARVM